MEDKKYILLKDDTRQINDHILYRIKAVKDLLYVNNGDLGGYIEGEYNLSQEDNSWVGDNACVYEDAYVSGNSRVINNALVYGNAQILYNSIVMNTAEVCGKCVLRDGVSIRGNSHVEYSMSGPVEIGGDSIIKSRRDYIVFKNWWSSGRYFVWTRSNNKWHVGCFYGSGNELITKAYRDSKISGDEYKRVVKYVNSILRAHMYRNIKKSTKVVANITGHILIITSIIALLGIILKVTYVNLGQTMFLFILFVILLAVGGLLLTVNEDDKKSNRL